MRISGLSSGLDVEQIIEDLMRVERIPVDRVFQQKVEAEWQAAETSYSHRDRHLSAIPPRLSAETLDRPECAPHALDLQ
ncbi:MAG TPA: hypothetical protein GX521_03110 [Firmicutes bacterium]|nr:hypothetical protein [Bacillota bacterium]